MPRPGVTLRLHVSWKGEDAFNSVHLNHSKHIVLMRKHTEQFSCMIKKDLIQNINLQWYAFILAFQ